MYMCIYVHVHVYKLTVSTIFLIEREFFGVVCNAKLLQKNLHQFFRGGCVGNVDQSVSVGRQVECSLCDVCVCVCVCVCVSVCVSEQVSE